MKKMVYVSLYTVERAYGGPEEGGWWYPYYELECWYEVPAGHHQQAKIRQAKKYLQEMKKDMPCYCEIFVEGEKGKYETTKKPIYC